MVSALFNIFYLALIIKNRLISQYSKVKVYVHINSLIPILNIYHIGVSFIQYDQRLRYDKYDETLMKYLSRLPNNSDNTETTFFWGYSNRSIQEIYEYEHMLNYNYILGFQDCRHYCNNLTQWSTGNGTPVWSLTNLL